MVNKLNYCNTCPKRANCSLYKENNFCEVNNNLLDKIYGYDKARTEELKLLFENQKSEETNPKCKYFIRLRKKITELVQFIDEIKKEKESEQDARL